MKNYIQKISLYHSLVFFLLVGTFSLILDQSKNLIISHVVCLFLIITIGISHGSLDHIKGKKLLDILKIDNTYLFFLAYIFTGLIIIILWLIIPAISLIIFLLVASYHFGKEDTEVLGNKNLPIDKLLYFLKGLLIIVAPLQFHFEETINIFKLLFVENEKFYIFLGFIENSKVLSFIFLLSASSSVYLFLKKFKFINFSILLDFFSILMLNYYLTPIIAFTFYFCFLHSIRHSFSLIFQINSENFKSGFLVFIKKALPLTTLTAAIYLIALFYLNSSYELTDAILKVIFIGLASLTFPHILLEYLLEKNEK